ncbi:MAG: alkaline phosphatase family protein [Solirubrobacteraceae bacterium]
MDGPPSPDAPDGDATDPDPVEDPELQGDPEAEQEDQEGSFPMPSPWAAAFAVIALLAFGVGLGLYVRPQESSPVLLAAAPGATSSTTTTSTSSSESEPASESEEESSPSASESKAEPKSEEASGKEESGGKGSESEEESEKGSKGGSGSKTESSTLPPIKHVFVIVLGEQGYESSFSVGSKVPYLASTLREQGELVTDYYGVASGQLANEIALISGQGPTPQTEAGCPTYAALSSGKSGSEGQALGSGCVYPISTLTLGDQLVSEGDTWKAYVQGLGEGSSAGLQGKCPNPALGSSDPYSTPSTSGPFVTWRDPFLYFTSVTASSNCAEENVGLGQLSKDLGSATTTPSLSYISPDPCEDGDPGACGSGGLPAAEGLLKKVVPEIESSAAYKEGGMIAITFDQAPQSGTGADDSGCCGTPKYPNLPASAPTTTASGQPVGGGRVGLLLISKYVKPGTSDVTGQYNHYSLLASVEALFKLQSLGYAGNVQLPTFEKAVYNAYS